jgi:hypothetical protein
MTVTMPQGAPSIAAAANQLGVKPEDIDAAYGVVPVDPDRGLYAVQVRADRLPRQLEGVGEGYRGPWFESPHRAIWPDSGRRAARQERPVMSRGAPA